MRDWDSARIAAETGARELRGAPAGPSRAAIDSRALAPRALFFGLRGVSTDGSAHAGGALRAGAWGVLVAPAHGQATLAAHPHGAVLVHEQPLHALQQLARAWRQELGRRGAHVVAITGSTGKTSTKDILAAILAGHMPTVSSQANLNTEIGLPLSVLAAGSDTRALVLEMAMRGRGQIAELTAIAQPDVGVIVNVGEAHLELLGSREEIAAAKSELLAGMAPGTVAVVPAGEELLAAHLRRDQSTVTFGAGGDVCLMPNPEPGGTVHIAHGSERIALQPSFAEAHNLQNLLAALAAARSLGVTPQGRLEVSFSAMRGQRHELPDGTVVIADCYNANPMSVRAALDELSRAPAGRRVAVLGDMLELGAEAPALHREIGRRAAETGVSLLVTVGPLAAEIAQAFPGESRCTPDAQAAAELLPTLLHGGETVLVKGSRGVGLERVTRALLATGAPGTTGARAPGTTEAPGTTGTKAPDTTAATPAPLGATAPGSR